MRILVINSAIATFGIAFFSIAQANATPNASDNEVAVVAALYKAFAWQAISGADRIFGKQLTQQATPALRRYFNPELTSLLVENQRCIDRTGEACMLDFDPLFASQDLGVADLSIESAGRGVVAVEFTYPSNGQKAQLEYRMVKHGKDWRIGDIRYRQWDNASLKQMLSPKSRRRGNQGSASAARMP